MKTHTCWIIRHSESCANAGIPTSNPATIPLTAKGIEQAKKISQCFKQNPSLIVTSPYLRCKQTSYYTSLQYPEANVVEWAVQEFTFLSPTRCQRTTEEERQPMVQDFWKRNDPFYVDGDGAESFSIFINRVWSFVDKLYSQEDEFIVVFTHGLFIYALIWSLLTRDKEVSIKSMSKFYAFSSTFIIPNGSIFKFEVGETILINPVLKNVV